MKWNPISRSICLVFPFLFFSCSILPTQRAESAKTGAARIQLSDAGSPSITGVRRIEPGDYFRTTRGGSAVLKLESQKNVVLDLTGVALRGAAIGTAADEYQGIGIWIEDCENIEIIGGTVGGYRVGLVVDNCDGVLIDGLQINATYGHRVALGSLESASGNARSLFGDTPIKGLERSGAGIAVVNSSEVEINGVHCRGGQNGLVMIGSESCEIEGNDFSYLSGFGIALENSDQNVVRDNRCNFISCGEDESQTRGAGSAGIVVAGDSTGNTITTNWAVGGSTGLRVLSGDTPCSDNRIVGNDFSRTTSVGAILGGTENTWFMNNVMLDCEGGGLLAMETTGLALCNNEFNGIMGVGLQLEGGARAAVRNNEFVDCDVAVEIHGEGAESMDHWVAENSFSVNIQDLVLEEAQGIEFFGNDFQNAEPRMHLDGLSAEGDPDLDARDVWFLLIDEQGDYPSGRSYRSQLRKATPESPAHLDMAGAWLRSSGFEPITPADGNGGDWIMGDFGPLDPAIDTPDAAPTVGALERVLWDATWFSWNTESDPRGDLERWRAGRFEPLLRRQVRSWSEPWGDDLDVSEALPKFNYGLIASGTLTIEAGGEFSISVRSDDGVRVLIDGEVILEDWSWHAERRTSEKITLEPGSHSIELEYFQLDGAAVLALDLDGPF